MNKIAFSKSHVPLPKPRPEVRQAVRNLLTQSAAFAQLSREVRAQIAADTALIADYLARPAGIVANERRSAVDLTSPIRGESSSQKLAKEVGRRLQATGARAGRQIAGSLTENVNFPAFVSGLVEGVFQGIVNASIRQMEAYGELLAGVAKSLNAFVESASENRARDYLTEQYPDFFKKAMKKPVPPKARRLATARQQLLATMVLMGINRIVVTDGKISAKNRQ